MNTLKEKLEDGAQSFGIELDKTAEERFEIYCSLLIEWNKKINLTAITEPSEIAVKHFTDSLSIMKYAEINSGVNIIDIGTGAGFPGIPLLIMNPDIKLTLLDSLNKRLIFLQDVLEKTGLNAEIIHSRAEEGGQNPKLREKFDFAVSRAVAPMNLLAEYCLPYIKVGGRFIAMKGPQASEEVKNAENAIKLMGCTVKRSDTFELPDKSARTLITIVKKTPTPKLYPRHGSKISKKPL